MRPRVPIELVNDNRLTAAYAGVFRRRIIVTSMAKEVLTADEFRCLIMHEVGHRELWHVERSISICLATAAAVVLVAPASWMMAILVLIAGHALLGISMALAEFEADRFAIQRCGPDPLRSMLTKAVTIHPDIRNSWVFRMRLRGVANASESVRG